MNKSITIIAAFLMMATAFFVTGAFSDDTDAYSSYDVDLDDAKSVIFDCTGGSGGYTIRVLPDMSYYMPTAELANAQKSGYCLVGWSSNGQFYEIGQEQKGNGSERVYQAVWMHGQATQMNMGTDWSHTTVKEPFGDYQSAAVKDMSITVSNATGSTYYNGSIQANDRPESRATISASFTPSVVGTYVIDISYTVHYLWGDCPHYYQAVGEYSFYGCEDKTYSEHYIVTFVDPSRSATRNVVWKVDGQPDTITVAKIGDTLTTPFAGKLNGTSNLAWWTVNYFGTGDVYFLPDTAFPVEDNKNLVFTAKMHDPGQGAIGYDFEGGTSSTTQIAYVYDIGSTVRLPTDVSRAGYHLAGWVTSHDPTTLYLPGTVLGDRFDDVHPGLACTDVDYIEMHAVWLPNDSTGHRVQFQNVEGTVVSSEYVPSGMKVMLPAYGFSTSFADHSAWKIDGVNHDIGATITVLGDTIADAVLTDRPSSYDTCTIIFITGDATSNQIMSIVNTGDRIVLPEIDRAGYIFCYWYEANGNIWHTGDKVTKNNVLFAKWDKALDISQDGNTISLTVLTGDDYSISWGDGSIGDESSPSHTYASNSHGKIIVTMNDGKHAGESAWVMYNIGASETEPIIIPVPPTPESGPDYTPYYAVGGAIALIFGLFIARRFI